jgi:hypothetical protein
VVAGIAHETGFRESEDDTAHAGPIDSAGAHGAGAQGSVLV